MKIREIMSKDVQTVRPEATLVEAAQKMRQIDSGAIPVCDGDKLKGILTDRDIVVRAIAEGKNPEISTVEEVLTAGPLWVYDDEDVKEANRLMEENQVRRLMVVDRSKKLVGIISLGDISQHQDEELAGNTLQEISEPTPPPH